MGRHAAAGSSAAVFVFGLVTKLRPERNLTRRPRLFRSHGVSSAGAGLKPPSDDPSASESSLLGLAAGAPVPHDAPRPARFGQRSKTTADRWRHREHLPTSCRTH